VTVKSLSATTNVPALAKEIVEKCKLIHPSKVAGLARLISMLFASLPFCMDAPGSAQQLDALLTGTHK
jgi:hypothetical protein